MLEQESQARAALEEKNHQLEEAKDAADTANRAKSTFLANLSHEIRTPLHAVLGYAQILQRDERLEDDQRRSVATIERSGSHLLTVINEILDLSKIESGQAELAETDFDLRELIQGLSELFELRCRQKGLEWRVEFGLAAENAKSAEITTQERPKELTTDHTDSADEGKTGDASDPCPSVSIRVIRGKSSRSLSAPSAFFAVNLHPHSRRSREIAPGVDQPPGQRREIHRCRRRQLACGRADLPVRPTVCFGSVPRPWGFSREPRV